MLESSWGHPRIYFAHIQTCMTISPSPWVFIAHIQTHTPSDDTSKDFTLSLFPKPGPRKEVPGKLMVQDDVWITLWKMQMFFPVCHSVNNSNSTLDSGQLYIKTFVCVWGGAYYWWFSSLREKAIIENTSTAFYVRVCLGWVIQICHEIMCLHYILVKRFCQYL